MPAGPWCAVHRTGFLCCRRRVRHAWRGDSDDEYVPCSVSPHVRRTYAFTLIVSLVVIIFEVSPFGILDSYASR